MTAIAAASRPAPAQIDVEWAHAIAPGRASCWPRHPGPVPQFIAAENYVINRNLGDGISQTFGVPEQTCPGFPGRQSQTKSRAA